MSWFGLFGRKKKPAPEAQDAAAEPGADETADAASPPEDRVPEEEVPADVSEGAPDDAGERRDADGDQAAAAKGEPPETAPEPRDADPLDAVPEPPAAPEAEAAPAPEPAPSPEAASPPRPEPEEPEARKGFFARLASGLAKSSSRLSQQMGAVFTKRRLDDEALEELEELLIAADIGAPTAAKVIAKLAREKFDKEVDDREVREALADVVAEVLASYEAPLDLSGATPSVVLFVGVNGSGKTTTLGKIAVKITRDGGSALVAAGDTFRAAAIEQLEVWSQRAGAAFLSRPLGSDAAGLAWDAVEQGRRDARDAVLIDTAGRLQNKAELMDELRKIVRVVRKLDETAPHHVVLVLDGTVGSNALSQAEAFMEAAQVTGVIMTKLDGTAKGGALVQVAERFRLPIHFIGVGEREDDLQPFSARAFARALAGLDD